MRHEDRTGNKEQELERIAERILEQDILACQSSLVDSLLAEGGREGWSVEDIENIWAAHVEDTKVEEEPEPREIFEWWLVTAWLAEKLQAIGQPILENDFGSWWGRTCTGQSILLDGTLQRVAARLLRHFES